SFATGCGGEEGLGKVNGVVTLDGKPLPDATVEFNPEGGKGLTSYGRTDKSGAYYMMATRSDKGAAVGKNKVSITTYDLADNGGKISSIPEMVPTKYNKSTELEVDVRSGSNKFDFDLKTEGGKVNTKKASPQDQ
ncbi:MAG: hypothetical protein ABL921_21545, partial [Pirellula sp.]